MKGFYLIVCPRCSVENEAGRKFCKECGTSLAVACPNCGQANSPDAKFCGECGTQLGGETPAAAGSAAAVAAPPALAERRLVSILFADLVGFTTLAEGRDPEETRELLTRYFGLARDVIERHGGTVEKFIGDAVMAVWGAPVAREDDAERAVRAALSLVDGVTSLGPGIEARAAVLTGEAAVTLGAIGEGMVAGDLVNTASRLQSVAPPGAVLVGDATERAANEAIVFEKVGDQTLRGKVAPVPAFRAIRVVAEVGGKNRAGGLEAPFVGRDEELRLLKDFFHVTGRDRKPRLVSIMGSAGIGKSRLAWEFSKYADGLVEDTYWHSGRSPSYGEGITFWALGEMVRRRAALLESDDEATTREKVSRTVEQWVTDPAERRTVEPALLALLGLGGAAGSGRDELFAAWRTFFERIAEHGTTVLLFEDLQWADSGLLDFIHHLLDWTKSLPLFVITLARPELLERRPEWGAGRRNFVSLALEPLSPAHMQELLEGLVPGLPASTRKAIVGRADGVPLYAVETVRMLVSGGNLREEGGVYRPVGELSTIAVPETLTALIAARLDALDAQDRGVVQAAAVLGQSFSVAALEDLSGIDAEQLRPIMESLVRRELFTVEMDPRSPERGQHSFVQALIREVAYNQLARNERKTRHLAAARWFESFGDEELAGVLAGHYAAAYRNAAPGPEADALGGQARIALRAAAERASNLGSRAQAVTFLMQALELTQDPGERATILERAGMEAVDAAPEEAHRYLDQALALYRSREDLGGIARSATGISMALQSMFKPAEAVPILELAVADTAAIEREPDAVRLLAELARAYANARHPKALELVDRVLELSEQLELMPIIAEALINRALVLNYAGRYYEPATLLRGVLPIAESHGLSWANLRALNNLSVALLNDDIRETEGLLRQAIEISRRTGALGSIKFFQAGLIAPLIMLGKWSAAEEIMAQFDDPDPADINLLDYFQSIAVYHALLGDGASAARELEAIRPVLAETSLHDMAPSAAWIEATVAMLDARLDEAYGRAAEAMVIPASSVVIHCAEVAIRAALWLGDGPRARKALEVMERMRTPGRVVKAMKLGGLASVDALEGRRAEAMAGFRDAVMRWRELELQVHLGLCLTDFAIALGPSEPGAAAAAEEANALWTRLGSPPLLARLAEGMARWPDAAADADKVQPSVSASPAVPKPG